MLKKYTARTLALQWPKVCYLLVESWVPHARHSLLAESLLAVGECVDEGRRDNLFGLLDCIDLDAK